MPLAGTIMWALVGVAGVFLDPSKAALALFIGTGSIFYLGLFLSKLTGENFMAKDKPKNAFDALFMQTVLMALLVFSLAIPFFLIEPTSLPLTVGILTGLMWIHLSWAIEHWVGLFHGVARTLLVLGAWYLLPDYRFVAITALIVCIYLVTIVALESRWRKVNALPSDSRT